MTTFALVTGALFRSPKQKVSKSGKSYCIATIKSRADDNRSDFWRVTVFSETAQAELMRLGEGDTLAAQGPMKCELYRPDGGEPRISLSIIADVVTPLKPTRKERPASKSRTDDGSKPIKRSRAAQAVDGGGREMPQLRHYGGSSHDPQLDDDLPF